MTHDAARAALEGLLDSPAAVHLEEPVSVGTIIAMAEEVGRARTERDTALARLAAVQQAVWPHIQSRDPVGDLARTVNAKARPDGDAT